MHSDDTEYQIQLSFKPVVGPEIPDVCMVIK